VLLFHLVFGVPLWRIDHAVRHPPANRMCRRRCPPSPACTRRASRPSSRK
jgi:hypothetical protein